MFYGPAHSYLIGHLKFYFYDSSPIRVGNTSRGAVGKLQKEIELKDPQKFIEYKNVILQLLSDFRRTIDLLDPSVKVDFCKLASTSSEFPLDCNSLDQPLPLPTPQSNPIGNSSDPCFALQTDRYLTALEINTLQIQCNDKKISNVTKSDNQRREEISNGPNTERAKERLNVGCDADAACCQD